MRLLEHWRQKQATLLRLPMSLGRNKKSQTQAKEDN